MDARYSFETLISAENLAAKVSELGEAITRDYKDKDTVFVGILKGSFIFMSDLVRKVKLDRLEICFMMVSSYGSQTRSSGNITIKKDLENNLEGKHVLIVEDIVDCPTARPLPSKSALSWISLPGERRIWCQITGALRYPMPLWWATAWITTNISANCPTCASCIWVGKTRKRIRFYTIPGGGMLP